jgi:hypothetical protein
MDRSATTKRSAEDLPTQRLASSQVSMALCFGGPLVPFMLVCNVVALEVHAPSYRPSGSLATGLQHRSLSSTTCSRRWPTHAAARASISGKNTSQ